jgi:uncharacterized membrane protein
VDGSYTTLDVPDESFTIALGINNAGQTVGHYFDPAGSHGFLLDVDGNYTTLDVPGAAGTDAHAINDAGQIVGRYFDATTREYGFLATPLSRKASPARLRFHMTCSSTDSRPGIGRGMREQQMLSPRGTLHRQHRPDRLPRRPIAPALQ